MNFVKWHYALFLQSLVKDEQIANELLVLFSCHKEVMIYEFIYVV